MGRTQCAFRLPGFGTPAEKVMQLLVKQSDSMFQSCHGLIDAGGLRVVLLQ